MTPKSNTTSRERALLSVLRQQYLQQSIDPKRDPRARSTDCEIVDGLDNIIEILLRIEPLVDYVRPDLG
jgi:hypothetical protein